MSDSYQTPSNDKWCQSSFRAKPRYKWCAGEGNYRWMNILKRQTWKTHTAFRHQWQFSGEDEREASVLFLLLQAWGKSKKKTNEWHMEAEVSRFPPGLALCPGWCNSSWQCHWECGVPSQVHLPFPPSALHSSRQRFGLRKSKQIRQKHKAKRSLPSPSALVSAWEQLLKILWDSTLHQGEAVLVMHSHHESSLLSLRLYLQGMSAPSVGVCRSSCGRGFFKWLSSIRNAPR